MELPRENGLVQQSTSRCPGARRCRGRKDGVGPGRPLILIVAGSGLATWGTSWLFFRAAGFELVTELDDVDDDET